MADDEVEALVAAVRNGAAYRVVSAELVARIGRQELASRRSMKEAVKATRRRLHEVHGAFLTAPRYERWTALLEQAAAAGDAAAWRTACAAVMTRHASTRERAPILDRFYPTLLADLPPIRSVVDLGCGLNPLAIPWMGLPPDATYRAYDVDAGLVAVLNRFFTLADVDGVAEVRDIVGSPPDEPADLTLALKLLPTLDRIAPQTGATVLRTVRAGYLIVSFPAHSLGGREKGMARQYDRQFAALAADEGWQIQRREFASELTFVVRP